MNIIDKNLELSYQQQRENFSDESDEISKLRDTWLREDTVDYWRHYRMVIPIKPLLDYFPGSRWLTVGDGRYALDAIRLLKIQSKIEVLPTDIASDLLKRAQEIKLIKAYGTENAESHSFDNDSFDFSFCKESFHHFPRPYIALYEMLRVSGKGVVLVEPNERKDHPIPERIIRWSKQLVKKMLGKPVVHPETWSFEVSGNFIYSVSKNEMEKVALGLRIPCVAFYYYNDYYEEGVEFQKSIPGNELFEKVKRKIADADFKCKIGLKTYSNIIAIFFKDFPDEKLRAGLISNGFQITDLPENPYVIKRKKS